MIAVIQTKSIARKGRAVGATLARRGTSQFYLLHVSTHLTVQYFIDILSIPITKYRLSGVVDSGNYKSSSASSSAFRHPTHVYSLISS